MRTFPLALFLLASAVVSCSSEGSSDDAPPAVAAPDPTSWSALKEGPYTCGLRELSLTYTPPGGLPARTIPVNVWYPSTATEGDHPTYQGIFPDPKSLKDVPLAPPAYAAGYPVLVHSHGYKGFPGNSARMMCHFASHGWVAAAPAHVGNLINDTPDPLPLSVFIHRPHDIRETLNLLGALPKEDPLAGKIDLGHVAASGHSFGTYTAWLLGGAPANVEGMKARCDKGDVAACTPDGLAALGADLSEPRARIVMPLAGAPDRDIAISSFDLVKVPVLQMSGTLDKVGDDKIFEAVSKIDLTWVEVQDGCHQLFGLGNSVLGDAGCKALADEEGFSLVNPWALAYARYHVLADRSAEVKGIVEGTTSISPKVSRKKKP